MLSLSNLLLMNPQILAVVGVVPGLATVAGAGGEVHGHVGRAEATR